MSENAYSQISQSRLASCHRELQLLFETVLEGFDHSIYCGHRSKADQEMAFETKKSKARWPQSMHNQYPSMAVDAGPYIDGVDRWDENSCRLFAGYVLGVAHMLREAGLMTYSVRWGGDWDRDWSMYDQKLNDLVHFELRED